LTPLDVLSNSNQTQRRLNCTGFRYSLCSFWGAQIVHSDYILLLLLLLVLTAVELSLGGSSPYTSRDKTNNKYIQMKQYKKTQYKQYKTQWIHKYTYSKRPTRYKTHTYTHPHISKQVKQTEYKLKHSHCKIFPN